MRKAREWARPNWDEGLISHLSLAPGLSLCITSSRMFLVIDPDRASSVAWHMWQVTQKRGGKHGE